MDNHFIKQLVKLNVVIKTSQRDIESQLWNIYKGIFVLLISLLIPFYLLFAFYSINLLYHFASMLLLLFFFFIFYFYLFFFYSLFIIF